MYPVEYFEIIAGSRIVDANSLAHLGFQRVMMRDMGRYLDAERSTRLQSGGSVLPG